MELEVELKVVNSPTVLSRVIEAVKRRRINIKSFNAEEIALEAENAQIKMIIETDEEKKKLLIAQLSKIIDVIKVK